MIQRFALVLFLMPLLLGASERIVTLSPALTQIVFDLGAGESVVGVTANAKYPDKKRKIPVVGDYFGVSLEKIVALSPTLVLLQRNRLDLMPKLKRLGIRSALIPLHSLDSITDAITDIGAMLGHAKEAKERVFRISQALETLRGILHDKKVLIVFGKYTRLDKAVYAAGSNLYFADIVRASGNRNALSKRYDKQPVLSYEALIGLNPDIVYILAHDIAPDQATRNRYKSPWLALPVNAARYGTVYIESDSQVSLPTGLGVIAFIAHFKEVLRDAKDRFTAF